MSRPRVFTPEIITQIPEWVAVGLSVSEIADRIGTTPESLVVTCSRLHLSLSRHSVQVGVSPNTRKAVTSKAAARGVSEAQLVSNILEKVAADDLWDAVLDDAERG